MSDRRRTDPRSGWFAPSRPRVLAHRGLTVGERPGDGVAPENTMLAFARALAAGADYLETDIHVSADGVAVVSHDPDLRRVAGRDERIDALTMAELAAIPLGQGQGFCSLAELLDGLPEARINLDLKVDGAVGPAVAAVAAAGAVHRVLVASFDGRRRRRAVRALPGVATSVSSVGAALALLGARLGVTALVAAASRGCRGIQIPPVYGPFSTSTARAIRTLQRAGLEVHYWTIDDPAEMTRLLDAGADGIVTDRADVALRVIAARRRRD